MTLTANETLIETILKTNGRWGLTGGLDRSHKQPDIIEFVRSPEFLNRPNLYPRQATLLKIIFLESEAFTAYDLAVIKEWETEYLLTADDRGEGNHGIIPGVLDRIRTNRLCPCGHDRADHLKGDHSDCLHRDGTENPAKDGKGGIKIVDIPGCGCEKYRGRWWFREVVSVIGRRGSKGHIGALCGAYILHHFIEMGDPQGHYGVDRDKRLTAIVFGAKKEQAKANQWRDINNVIMGAPVFSKYISRPQAERITVESPYDTERKREMEQRGVYSDQDIATFEIVPKEATVIAARGPAAFLQYYDEAAHVVKGVANTPAKDVYDSAVPALDQFGKEGFIYLPSSPWQKIGLFYEKYQQSLEVDEETGHPIYPEMLMIQLTSWDIYEDWEVAPEIPLYPESHPMYYLDKKGEDGKPLPKFFPKFHGAIQTYDAEMERLERANPETFKVERRAHFAAVMDAYLNPDRIATIWEEWQGEKLQQLSKGNTMKDIYRAHGDPSKSGAGFGFAIAHVERPKDSEFPHVVFDRLHSWLPQDYENHQIDYQMIGEDIKAYLDGFMPAEMTFDQFNSVGIIQSLQRHVKKMNYHRRVEIYERPATGPLNWKTFESFKTALGLGLIHAPYFELADLELTYLQDLGGKVDHPTAGPVQTKDVADCMAIVTYELIGDEMMSFLGQDFSEAKLSGKVPGGFDAYSRQREEAHDKLSAFGRNASRSRGNVPRPRR